MSLRRLSLFALSLAALPIAAHAQEEGVTGARILACEADRTGENCATLLSQLYVCKEAEEMAGCAELLALREAAVDLSEREEALNGGEAEAADDEGTVGAGTNGDGAEDEEGIITEPEDAEDIEVEVRAEGELVDELEDEALTDGEENLRDEDGEEGEGGSDAAADSPESADANAEGAAMNDPEDGADAEAGANSEDGTEAEGAAMDNATACPVLNASDWAAWVNAMPGPDGPSLIVTGVVTLPSPGYSVTLEAGMSDRSARPVQVVQLVAQPPEGAAAQVLSDYDLRFEMASSAPEDGTIAPFTAVRVVCGDQEIARIEPVEVAQ